MATIAHAWSRPARLDSGSGAESLRNKNVRSPVGRTSNSSLSGESSGFSFAEFSRAGNASIFTAGFTNNFGLRAFTKESETQSTTSLPGNLLFSSTNTTEHNDLPVGSCTSVYGIFSELVGLDFSRESIHTIKNGSRP